MVGGTCNLRIWKIRDSWLSLAYTVSLRPALGYVRPTVSWHGDLHLQPQYVVWHFSTPSFFCFQFLFGDRVSVCSPDCPGTF